MPPKRSFWQRRMKDPLLALLTQGVTPARLAVTLALGTVCSLFPILGTTTALNFVVGMRFRLNQPILHTLNQLLGPVQLMMVLVYVSLGEWLWRTKELTTLSVLEMVKAFGELPLLEFMQRFGLVGLHAITAWAVTAPLLFALLYFPFKHLFVGIAQRRRRA